MLPGSDIFDTGFNWQRGYEDHRRMMASEARWSTPYASGHQHQVDAILANYRPDLYVRGWLGAWSYKLTHWIVSDRETTVEALCEIARLREEARA